MPIPNDIANEILGFSGVVYKKYKTREEAYATFLSSKEIKLH